MPPAFVLSAPVYFSLELTPACNNRCPVCSNVFARHPAALSVGAWKQIIEQIAPHAEIVKITGGEPTLHPEFDKIVKLLAERNLKFAVFTNGRWQKPEAVIELLKSVPQCTGLLISLHGPDAPSHEGFTHTPGSFAETCANIQRATNAGLHVHTSTVLTRYNWAHLEETVSLAKSLGARRAVFNRYLGLSMPEIEMEERQLREAVSIIEKLMAKYNTASESSLTVRYGNCVPQCFMPSSSTGCWAGIAYCTIDPWGNMRPCNHSPTIAGNLFAESLDKIWQGEKMNAWRSLTPETCFGCSAFETCHGGCRAMIEIQGGTTDPLMRAPFPDTASFATRDIELYEGEYPTLQCQIREEDFGYALIRGHNIIPITFKAKSVLDTLNGQQTLQQIKNDFGQDALDFVGNLYLNGMVKFVDA